MRDHALDTRVAKGATPYEGDDKTMDVPAIVGIGGSLIYFIDQYYEANPYNDEFDWVSKAHPEGVGFYYLDHLTHNVHKGNMDLWFSSTATIFNFKEIRFFDIEGKFTGLLSRALTSPCGRIRIPINEDRGDKGQIVEYLKRYKGEGIQHIAVGAKRHLRGHRCDCRTGLKFMPAPTRQLLRDVPRPCDGSRRADRADEEARHPDRRRRCGRRR